MFKYGMGALCFLLVTACTTHTAETRRAEPEARKAELLQMQLADFSTYGLRVQLADGQRFMTCYKNICDGVLKPGTHQLMVGYYYVTDLAGNRERTVSSDISRMIELTVVAGHQYSWSGIDCLRPGNNWYVIAFDDSVQMPALRGDREKQCGEKPGHP